MPRFKHPPIHRHPTLRPLSRDHYTGLVQARRLMQSAAGDPIERRAAVAAFLDAWRAEIAQHFADEERLLAPLAAAADRQRLMREHAHLRSLAEEAQERRRRVDPGAPWVRRLSKALRDHIRWEERTMFPRIEAAAADELERMHAEAEAVEASRGRGLS